MSAHRPRWRVFLMAWPWQAGCAAGLRLQRLRLREAGRLDSLALRRFRPLAIEAIDGFGRVEVHVAARFDLDSRSILRHLTSPVRLALVRLDRLERGVRCALAQRHHGEIDQL